MHLPRSLPWMGLCCLVAASDAVAALPPLSVEEAVQLASQGHPQVRAASAQRDIANERVPQARAAYLPQFGHTAQLRGDLNHQTAVPEDRADIRNLRYSGQLNGNQLLYDFGRTAGRLDASRAGARAAAHDLEGVRAGSALSAITAFANVLIAEALYAVAQRSVAQQESRQKQAESLYSIGTRPEIDVLIAKTGVAQARVQLLSAKNAILNARVQLLAALGVADLTKDWLSRPLLPLSQTPIPQENAEPAALVERALSQRPEYAALTQRIRQAEAQKKAALGDFYPSLSLVGSAGISGFIDLLGRGTTSGTAGGGGVVATVSAGGQPAFALGGGLQVNWPFFTGLSTVHAVREAEAQLKLAQANLDNLRQQVQSSVVQAQIQVQASLEGVSAAESVRTQAELALSMAQGRYQAGVGNIIELGDAQVAAIQAQAQRAQADYNLALARATLRLQLGELIPRSHEEGQTKRTGK